MTRLMTSALVALAIAASIIPAASAANIGTSTCPVGGRICVGSGGSAGR